MAEEWVFSKEPAIVWKTVIPACSYLGIYKKSSPVFSLLGITWELQLWTDSVEKFYFGVSLKRIVNELPSSPFTAMTFIQTTDSVTDGSQFRSQGYKRTITDSVTTLVTDYINLGTTSILGSSFASGTKVTVVCVFTDMPSNTSGIPHETVEVMTQTEIECAVSVEKIHALSLSSDECEEGSSSLSPNLCSLSRDLSKLLEDKVVSDVNLRCGDRTIAAHKAILAARSQVFSAMFQSRMLESETGVVDIVDVDAQVLEMFLKYVFSGKLSHVPNESLPSLYAAGDKYAVGSLKTACSERMISKLTRENCLNTLLLANAHSDQDFKNVIFNFILNHMEILKSEEWTRFCKENQSLSIEVFQTVVQQKCF